MLTFEYEQDNVVEIFMDADGRDDLVRLLTSLTGGDHEHLLTASWGGSGLSEDFHGDELVPVHSVTISMIE